MGRALERTGHAFQVLGPVVSFSPKIRMQTGWNNGIAITAGIDTSRQSWGKHVCDPAGSKKNATPFWLLEKGQNAECPLHFVSV